MIARLNNQAFCKAYIHWHREINGKAILVRASAYGIEAILLNSRLSEYIQAVLQKRRVIWTRRCLAIGIDYQQDVYCTKELQSANTTVIIAMSTELRVSRRTKEGTPEIDGSKADSDKKIAKSFTIRR